MAGDRVIVRDCKDKPLVRRVWDEDGKAVYIHSEEEFHKAIAGKPCLLPVGFPARDVFEYDPALIAEDGTPHIVPWDWSKARARKPGGSN